MRNIFLLLAAAFLGLNLSACGAITAHTGAPCVPDVLGCPDSKKIAAMQPGATAKPLVLTATQPEPGDWRAIKRINFLKGDGGEIDHISIQLVGDDPNKPVWLTRKGDAKAGWKTYFISAQAAADALKRKEAACWDAEWPGRIGFGPMCPAPKGSGTGRPQLASNN